MGGPPLCAKLTHKLLGPSKTDMLILKVTAILALLASISWLVAQPGYEPAIAVVTSLSALIGVFVAEQRRRTQGSQEQHVGKHGIGIQAGGDVRVGSDRTNDK